MKHLKILLIVIIIALSGFSTSQAQFNPYTDLNGMATLGLGASGRGIPIFARFEKGIKDNISIGGQISNRSFRNNYFDGDYWRHTVIGIAGRGSYHFNELLGLDDQWDLYSGVSLGYYVLSTRYVNNNGFGVDIDYTGTGLGGLYLGFISGGRYFINDRLALNVEFGGGSIGYWDGTIGLTLQLN
ncbi:MAG: hypothetical protein AAGI07_14995 [Bacteroidota bacterium]